MTRKDYEVIAHALRQARNVPPQLVTAGTVAQWEDCCLYMAADLKALNPRFNRERFLKACGVEM